MADKTVRVPVHDSAGLVSGFVDMKLVDIGGGTYATAVATQGLAADGAAASGNPMQIAGVDGSGNVQALATDTSGNQQVVGNVASGATDSGSPVKTGGRYNSTLPTLTNGQRGDFQIGTRGSQNVTLFGQDTTAAVWVNPIATTGVAAGSFYGLFSQSFPMLHNGSTWDTQTGNLSAVLLASGARTSTQTGADTVNYNARGIVVNLSVTNAGTGSITVSIQGKDANGIYYTILTGAAVVTNSVNTYTIYPGNTVAANASVSTILPRNFRIVVTHNNANSITYSVGYELIV